MKISHFVYAFGLKRKNMLEAAGYKCSPVPSCNGAGLVTYVCRKDGE